MTINLRAQISDYASRVLGVVKEKYGLKDKKLMAKIRESENEIFELEKSILETINN